jgi:hypothetical protein
MNGPPICATDGGAFYRFMTHPPRYDAEQIYSITAIGKITRFNLEEVTALTRIEILSFDSGVSSANMLLLAAAASSGPSDRSPKKSPYLARFNYDGTFKDFAQLDLPFLPVQVAQLGEDSFFVIGSDMVNALPATAIIDGGGRLLRRPDVDEVAPSEDELKNMVNSMSFAGIGPQELPPAMRVYSSLSGFQFAHSEAGLLLLEPGDGARIVELSPGRETHVVKLKLPKGQIADSILPARGKWLIRTYPEGVDNQSNMFEVDPESGETLREIRSPSVPATSIACASKDGLYGLRWVDHKPYVIVAQSH